MLGLGLSIPQVAVRLGTGGGSTILIPASARNAAPASTIITAGGVEGGTNAVTKHKNNTAATLKNFRVQVWRVGYDAGMNLIRTADNVLEFRHALEIGGTRYRMQRDGSDDFNLATTDDFARGDALAQSIAPGAVVAGRMWQHVPALSKYIGAQGSSLASLGEVVAYGGIGSQPDRTLVGNPTPANGIGSANYWLLAEAPAGTRSMLAIGDSICAGLNETSTFTSDADGHVGAACRWAAAHGYNAINIAKPSSTAQNWVAKDKSALAAMLAGITFDTLWMGLGRNDYASNRTAAQIKADVEATIAWAKSICPTITRVIVRDLPPTTTGDFTTVEGQNDRTGQAITQEAERVAYNAIVAAKGISGQTDYFAFASSCQATKANGTIVWPAAGTTDGIHPAGAINAAAVAANNFN